MKYLKTYEILLESTQPYLCDLNLDELIKNFDENIFGSFQDKIDNEEIDLSISKSLCLNGEIIGGCLLKKQSMLESINTLKYWIDNKYFNNLIYYISDNKLNMYNNKKGILISYIYIKEEYRNNYYSKILTDYINKLGDYTWGISIPDISLEYWLKNNRIKILEYTDNNKEKSVITATKLK